MIGMEAQAVVTMRLMGMAGLWGVSADENVRMVDEKMKAAQKGMLDASRAAMRGGNAITVMTKAVAPVRRATRGNVKRLQKGNPMLPQIKGK
ncbi:MAG: antifreeze protein [Roseinatronobacter sp.]